MCDSVILLYFVTVPESKQALFKNILKLFPNCSLSEIIACAVMFTQYMLEYIVAICRFQAYSGFACKQYMLPWDWCQGNSSHRCGLWAAAGCRYFLPVVSFHGTVVWELTGEMLAFSSVSKSFRNSELVDSMFLKLWDFTHNLSEGSANNSSNSGKRHTKHISHMLYIKSFLYQSWCPMH